MDWSLTPASEKLVIRQSVGLLLSNGIAALFLSGCGSIVSFKKQGNIAVRGSNQHSKKCTWLSIPNTPSSSNDIITFQFSNFHVPCHHGHVKLHARGDGGKINTFCGADPPPVTSLPASGQITLEIKLEKGIPVWGFDLQHKTEYLGNKN